MQHNSNITQALNQLIARSGKHAQIHPLPSSIKTVRFLCFLWHSGPAFEMQFWKDFTWPFWLFSQQQRSMRGKQRVDPLLGWPDVVLTTDMPYFPENCLFYASVPHDSRADVGRDILEASLTHHTFSSHHPRQPGPDAGSCDSPKSENFFQLSMEIGRGEKLNYQTLASVFPSSNTGHTLLMELSSRGQTKSLLHSAAPCIFVFLLADTANRNAVTTVQLTWRRLSHICASPPGQQKHHDERCVSPLLCGQWRNRCARASEPSGTAGSGSGPATFRLHMGCMIQWHLPRAVPHTRPTAKAKVPGER